MKKKDAVLEMDKKKFTLRWKEGNLNYKCVIDEEKAGELIVSNDDELLYINENLILRRSLITSITLFTKKQEDEW